MSEATAGSAQQPDKILTFEHGIPGFDDAKHFVLADLTDDGIFQQLTCLEDPELILVVMFPWLAFPDYSPDLPDAELRNLDITTPEDVTLFCTVIVVEDEETLYVNLRAPFVVNSRTLEARQIVLDDESIPMRAPIRPGG